MEARQLEKYRQQLRSQMPLIGGWLKDQALKTLVEDGSAPAIRLLEDAALDGAEQTLRAAALEALEQLAKDSNVPAREALCRMVLHHDHAAAREIVLAARYVPHDESYRALFYFLTDQWNAYEQLDFDHQLLRTVYETADRTLRNRIAARARQAGRLEWVDMVAGGKHGKRLALMTDPEWKAALAVLGDGERTKDLWQLAQEAPPRWSAQILTGLKRARGLIREDEHGTFEELTRLAKQWEDTDFSAYFHHRLTLEGHPHQIRCLALTASGKILASGGADHNVRLWRLADGHLLKTLEGHVDWVNGLAPTPNGRVLISTGRDGRLCIWRLPSGRPTAVIEAHSEAILTFALSPDGRLLATGSSDCDIRIWRLPDGKLLHTLEGHTGAVSCLAMDAERQVLASGSKDCTVRLWSLQSGKALKTLEGHRDEHGDGILCMAISPDGRTLASAGTDSTIQLWSLPAGRPGKTLKIHTGSVHAIAINPENTLMASAGGEYAVQLWRLPGGKLVKTLESHVSEDPCLVMSSDGRLLAASSRGGWGPDHIVRVWSLRGRLGQPPRHLSGHTRTVTCLAISPDNSLLASGGDDGVIRIWSAELERLSRLPVGKATLQDLEWVQSQLRSDTISEAEQRAFRFIAALMRWRRRGDIFVDDAAPRVIEVGEFDIEIEG